MRAIDWVGLVLIGAVGVGGAVYFVKNRPLQPNGYADLGVPVPVVGQGQNFVVQTGGGAGSAGGQDAANVINSVTGLARGLFPNGIGGLFG